MNSTRLRPCVPWSAGVQTSASFRSFVTNAASLVPPQTPWVRICIWTRSPRWSLCTLMFAKLHSRWPCDLPKSAEDGSDCLFLLPLCVVPSTEMPTPPAWLAPPWSLGQSSNKLHEIFLGTATLTPLWGHLSFLCFPVSRPSLALWCNRWLLSHLRALVCDPLKDTLVSAYNMPDLFTSPEPSTDSACIRFL